MEPVYGVHSLVIILTAFFTRSVFVSHTKPLKCCAGFKLVFADLMDLLWQTRGTKQEAGDPTLTKKMEIGLERLRLDTEQ